MHTEDIVAMLPRLDALRVKLGDSVQAEFTIWLHDHSKYGGTKTAPPVYGWTVWDGTTHHTAASLHEAIRVAEYAHGLIQQEPVGALILPDKGDA